MRYSVSLGALLIANWLLWSGYFDHHFLTVLGVLSCLGCLWLSHRMRIVDQEGAPAQLGIRPFTSYAPWLVREIVVSNLQVAKIILARDLKLARTMIKVPASQKTAIGRVIYANSITLTPGTISVTVEENKVRVHALNLEGAEDDLSGLMNQKVTRLEGTSIDHSKPEGSRS